jgi:hypothetical protein
MVFDSKILRSIGEEYAKAFGIELIKQGREARAGGLIKSLQVKTYPTSIEILGNDYWRYVNKGVRANQIRYPKAPARINALIQWLKRKGVAGSDSVIRGIAYAIAYTHSKVGMPTMNGRIDRSRLNFVDKAIQKRQSQIDEVVELELGKSVDLILKKL